MIQVNMGCISSAPEMNLSDIAPSSNLASVVDPKTGLTRQVTIKLTSPDNDDIVIVKHGSHYIIQGTKAVIDIMSCRIIGYLDEQDVFQKQETDYVKDMCKKYDMVYL